MLIVTALYLGSWWALQEGSWGGWWNWDASEFLGLLIFYFIVTLFHIRYNLQSLTKLYQSLYLSLSYLFIYFFFLQLNFSVISHNFGFRTLKFLNTEVLLFSFLFFFITVYTFTKHKEHFMRSITHIRQPSIAIRILLFHICLILFNLVVFTSLLSFFFKTLFNFKVFISFISFNKLLFSLLIFLYLHFVSITVYFYLLLFVTTFYMYYTLIYAIPYYVYSRNFIFHYLIYVLVLLSLFYKHSTLNDSFYTNFTELLGYTSFMSFSNHDIEVLLNFITHTTSFEGKSFNLLLNNNYLYQVYFLNSTYWHSVVTTIDNLPSVLNTLLTATSIYLGLYFYKKYNVLQ